MNTITPSRVLTLFFTVLLGGVTSSASFAQFFGPPGFGFGYGPQVPIAFPFSSRYIARRQAMMERISGMDGFPYPYPIRFVSPYAASPYLEGPYLDRPYLEGPYTLAPEVDIILARPPLGAALPLPALAPFPRDLDAAYAIPLPPSAAGAFAASASRLTAALSRHENGEVWIDFLQSDRLAVMATNGRLPDDTELRNLVARYQGVPANPELAWLVATDGFEDTLAGLLAITSTSPDGLQEVSPIQQSGQRSPAPRREPTVAPSIGSAQGNTADENNADRNRNSERESDTNEPEVWILPAPQPQPEPATTSL